jgi:acetyl esterase/lipase
VAFVGHSAGGHLVVWLAGAWTIATGPLASAATLEPAAVFVLGGVPDLSTAAEACGDKAVQAMTGAASAGRPDPLADTSGAALLPLGVTLAVRNGGADETATPANAKAFAAKAKAAGDRVSLEITPRQGHAEEIAPGSPAWDHAAAEIVRALRVDRRNPSFDAGADRP